MAALTVRFTLTQFAATVIWAGALVFKNAPVIGPIPTILPGPQMPMLSAGWMLRAMGSAFIIAFLGSVSTLMGAVLLPATLHMPTVFLSLVAASVSSAVSVQMLCLAVVQAGSAAVVLPRCR